MPDIFVRYSAPQSGITEAGSYDASAVAGGGPNGGSSKKPTEIPADVIYGWNWKESMPNAVISQLTTFLCFWALENDYDGNEREKNPRVKYWKDLLQSGYELSSQIQTEIEYDDGVIAPPRIRPINYDYKCYIDGTPVKYIPALPNVSQVLTKDAKGGVGVSNIAINDVGSGNFAITLQMNITNPYELMEQSSFWRFFTIGQQFLLTIGWQDEGQGMYNPYSDAPERGHPQTGVLAQRFKDWPYKRIIPPIVDPATGMLHRFFHNIKTTDYGFMYPANGFWQSYYCTLQNPSFTLNGNGLQGNLTLNTIGQFVARQILTGQTHPGAGKWVNESDKPPAIVSEKNADFNATTAEYDKDNNKVQQVHAIKLGLALKALCASYNTAVYTDGDSNKRNQAALIYYSDDPGVNIGDEIDAPMTVGVGPKGKCNFYLGIPEGGSTAQDSENGITPDKNGPVDEDTVFNNIYKGMQNLGKDPVVDAEAFNAVKEKILQHPSFKEKAIYWQEDGQMDVQKAEDKKQITLADSVVGVADIPIMYQTFKKWLTNNSHWPFDSMLTNFCDAFLYQEFGLTFRLVTGHNNTRVLVFMDQYLKRNLEQDKVVMGAAAGMPALEFRQYILDEFRWRYFTLRFADVQSLVKDASMIKPANVKESGFRYRAMINLGQNLMNSGFVGKGEGDKQNPLLVGIVDTPGTNTDRQEIGLQVTNNDGTVADNSTTPTVIHNEGQLIGQSADGSSNASNKGSAERNAQMKQFLWEGIKDSEGMGIDGAIGSYLKFYFMEINVSIHGTFGLLPTSLVYFIGLFDWLRGFYSIKSVSHEISPGEFVTNMVIVWTGADHKAPGVSLIFNSAADKSDKNLKVSTGMSYNEVSDTSGSTQQSPDQITEGGGGESVPGATRTPVDGTKKTVG